jgi:hypothetical protein
LTNAASYSVAKNFPNFYITKLKNKTQNPSQDSETNRNAIPNNTPIYEGRDKMNFLAQANFKFNSRWVRLVFVGLALVGKDSLILCLDSL